MADGNLTGLGASTYEKVKQDHSYETDLGFAVMPVAGRTPKFRRIRLHGGIGFRRVSWETSRANTPPIIPTPTDTANDYILSSVIVPSLPQANPNQAGYNWNVRGEYLYVERTPRAPQTNTLPTGGFPFPIEPTDSLARGLTTTIAAQLKAAGNPDSTISDLTIIQVGQGIDNVNDNFVWPFTTLAPVFTSPNLIGG